MIDLQVGDLILVRGQRDFISKAIRFFTKGDYEHVEMVLGKFKYDKFDRLMISSNAIVGVHLTNIERYIKNKVEFDIFRWHNDLSDIQKELLFLDSKKYLHQKYDYTGALSNVIPFIKHSKNRQFCSELVRRLYESINHILFDKEPNKTTPNDIAKSEYLVKIHEQRY